MRRQIDLPDVADTLAVRFHQDGVHATVEVLDEQGEMQEWHSYANPHAIVDGEIESDAVRMTDGGHTAVGPSQSNDSSQEGVETESEGRGPHDPEDLIPDTKPAKIQRSGFGNELVADYNVLKSGWIRVTEWDGNRVKFPPHEIQAVREVQVERYGERGQAGFLSRRLADPELIEEAREKGAIESDG